jgi:hypothetical protein
MNNEANTARIVAYWRDSLLDAELEGLDPKQEAVFSAESSTLETGRLEAATVEQIFEIVDENATNIRDAGTGEPVGDPETATIIIAPIVAQRYSRSRRRVR